MHPRPDLLVVGGVVVNDDWSGPGTVVAQGGRITAVLGPDEPLPRTSDETRLVDATGRLVLPGGVDPHTHIGMSLGNYTTRDGYPEATTAALWGGTTTVVDFAIPTAGQLPLDAVVVRRKAAGSGRCDAALHGCVVDWDDTVPEQLREMAELGVRTIKLFTTYRDVVMADPGTVLRVMETLRGLGGLAYVHAEANHLVEQSQESAVADRRIDAAGHAHTRPELAEVTAVREVLASAATLDVPVYFVHQSTPEAIDEVRRARSRGVRAYTETCPHYLTLNGGVYGGPFPERYVCCPPLRSAATVAGVTVRALAREVDAIGSDHCCYTLAQKQADCGDVRIMPNGMPGVETRLPVVFTELVHRGGMPVERFVALTAANPARLNGIHPRKGVIAPGSDADLIVVDPAETRTVVAAELHMATDYSPYEGFSLRGWPGTVVVAGQVVIDDGAMSAGGHRGTALDAAPLSQDRLIC